MPADNHRLALCSWSLQPADCDELIQRVKQTTLPRVQLALGPLIAGVVGWDDARRRLADAGVELVSGMVGAVAEDYTTIARIEETGGVMPDATWPATRANMLAAAPIARQLDLNLVTFHAGFIPESDGDPLFAKAKRRITEAVSLFADQGVHVALETGQESAWALLQLLDAINMPEIGINFDPANMLLYGSGEPVSAFRLLAPRVRQIHIKDAHPSPAAGQWGEEVPVGKGSVNWQGLFEAIDAAGYGGDLVIEREAGTDRMGDIRTAADFVRNIRAGSSF